MMEGEDGDTVGRDMDGWVETLGMGGYFFLCLFVFFLCLFVFFPLSFCLVNLVEVWVILWLGGLKL